jgi:hypothetical protein
VTVAACDEGGANLSRFEPMAGPREL